MARPLTFSHRRLDGVLVLDLSGDLVVGDSANALWEAMSQVWEEGARKVMLNMSGVEYIDSTGVGALLGAHKSAADLHAQLKLCCVPPSVSHVLGTLRVSAVLESYEDEARALASFSHPGALAASCGQPGPASEPRA